MNMFIGLLIVKTIRQDPLKLLERNNGIVFKAKKVEFGDNEKQLILIEGSVVNGWQTTVSISEYAEQTCYVPVKIVEALDPENQWEIAQAANYQNKIRNRKDSLDIISFAGFAC